MKCPLIMEVLSQGTKVYSSNRGDCLKEECAWWDKVMGRCAVLSLVDIFTDLNARITRLGKTLATRKVE